MYKKRLVRKIAVVFVAFLAACSGGGGGGNTPAGPTFPKTVPVVVTQVFSDTDIGVTAGKQLTISATGMVNYMTNNCNESSCVVSPAGLPTTACSSLQEFPAPTLPCWSLIGKIGASGATFEVGTSLSETATSSGDLYLGINDNYPTDNTGSWSATVNEM